MNRPISVSSGIIAIVVALTILFSAQISSAEGELLTCTDILGNSSEGTNSQFVWPPTTQSKQELITQLTLEPSVMAVIRVMSALFPNHAKFSPKAPTAQYPDHPRYRSGESHYKALETNSQREFLVRIGFADIKEPIPVDVPANHRFLRASHFGLTVGDTVRAPQSQFFFKPAQQTRKFTVNAAYDSITYVRANFQNSVLTIELNRIGAAQTYDLDTRYQTVQLVLDDLLNVKSFTLKGGNLKAWEPVWTSFNIDMTTTRDVSPVTTYRIESFRQ